MSKYTIFQAGQATDFARSTKATVVTEAERLRKSKVRDLLEVRTEAGNVVFALKEVKARVITKHTKPYTKTITLPAELQALVPAGYATAYERPRNDAVVLRREAEVEDDDSLYAVMQRSTGVIVDYAPTTRAAGQIMKSMRVKANA